MLFTRCPDCDTTFRVTDDALKKANGQVRCGRCASVFNAYAERRDAPEEPAAEAGAQQATASTPVARESSGVATEQTTWTAAPAPRAGSEPVQPLARPERAREPSADPLDSLSVDDVVAQLEQGAVDEAVDTGELAALTAVNDDAIPPAQVEAVLETEAIVDWQPGLEEPRPDGAWLGPGVFIALLALALQVVNHYRADLVRQPVVGSLVQRTYAAFGVTVMPRWDVRQYVILDWVATAEPSSGGLGSLKITARIKNRGPEYQPYPSVNLRLKDRWEAAVGVRTFTSTEYLAAAPRRLMAPGETARAQLDVVDPGPDAYGFELDVCIEVETHVLSCGSDKVFL
jgi:predicted Zn finger-like uncharacterized protein